MLWFHIHTIIFNGISKLLCQKFFLKDNYINEIIEKIYIHADLVNGSQHLSASIVISRYNQLFLKTNIAAFL